MSETVFTIAAEIEAASIFITQLPLSQLRLMNDSRFPWLLLVPAHPKLVEWTDLSSIQLQELAEEIRWATELIHRWSHPHKVNIASLGNIVRQMHVHIVGRETTDAAWPGPVWGNGSPTAFSAEEILELCTRLSAGMTEIREEAMTRKGSSK
jgi:diadenosine tetraphosphate (Ap4A) HIT family hydrolase